VDTFFFLENQETLDDVREKLLEDLQVLFQIDCLRPSQQEQNELQRLNSGLQVEALQEGNYGSDVKLELLLVADLTLSQGLAALVATDHRNYLHMGEGDVVVLEQGVPAVREDPLDELVLDLLKDGDLVEGDDDFC